MLAEPPLGQTQAIGDVGLADFGRMAAVDVENVKIQVFAMHRQIGENLARIAGEIMNPAREFALRYSTQWIVYLWNAISTP